MKTEMKMPQMGESIAEATILKWLKQEGDKVEKDETILEISTDKVDSEIPAPASGTLLEIKAKEGDVVPVKSVIALIGDESDDSKTVETTAVEKSEPKKSEPEKEEAIKSEPKEASPSGASGDGASASSTATTDAEPSGGDGDRFYSPLVKSLASQHGITAQELASIHGSGTNGRVTKSDVMEFLDRRDSTKGHAKAPEEPQASTPAPKKDAPAPQVSGTDYGLESVRVEPMDRMRKIIAEHMVRSKATSPHVYTMAECDVTTVAKWRAKNQKAFLDREGFKLSFTPFFLEAAVKALIQYPHVNASVDGDNVILKRDINLGCAVALGTRGLIVPTIKKADQLSFIGIARSLNDIALRARDKRLQPDEIQGGTFTVTNPGIFGSIMGCPIINQPQLAILAIGAIKKRPVVVDNAIAIRDMVYLTLSYDHRVVDGSLGGQFLQFIVKHLESWDLDRELF